MDALERIYAPVEWYFQFTTTPTAIFLGERLQDLEDSPSAAFNGESTLKVLLSSTRKIRRPPERAYALLMISKAYAQEKNLAQSQALLAEGLALCKDRNEKQAILEWILGSIEWLGGKGLSGYQHWQNATQTLALRAKAADQKNMPGTARWYRERKAMLEALVVELTGSVQSGYMLFDRHKKTRLTKMTRDLVNVLKDEVAAGRTAEAKKIMEILETNTRFSEEFAEAMVECGMAAYQLDEISEALRCLRLAQVKYLADRETLLAVSWMLASAQFELDQEKSEALKNWQACEKILQELSTAADRMKDAHNPEKKQWFSVLAELLKKLPG